jgi:hypothetical protein
VKAPLIYVGGVLKDILMNWWFITQLKKGIDYGYSVVARGRG